LNYRLETQLTK